MLWRQGYSTREMEPAVAPPVVGNLLQGPKIDGASSYVLLGGFDLSAFSELAIWRKLVEEAAPSELCLTLYFLDSPTLKVHSNALAVTPVSLRHLVGIAEHAEEWRQLIQPDRPSRSFGAILRDGVLDPLMVGVPTEESWERFRNRLMGSAKATD